MVIIIHEELHVHVHCPQRCPTSTYNSPGPFASLLDRRPSLNITALSYSGTTLKYATRISFLWAIQLIILTFIRNKIENGKKMITRNTDTTNNTPVHNVVPQPAASFWLSSP